ncbi:hypothetical protein A2118_01960 [Candidatus Kaiserbacteria bacterium GWA2_50_9]|uniref:Laccase domain-containing protein n=1 Tax=Candidatus Kaiserbacteria bacterium GWA2_50_9 TaxID=1798474 RepID=A0A1F6BUH3_9BACT|nr:MAG: hypothetical protein A2118_01960 [Candidatus Kaiserbacteria bacterium GWA2_50_9]
MNVEVFLPSEQIREGIVIPKLTHGSDIVTIVSGEEDIANCDALITRNRALSLGVRTADCSPICFSDGRMIGIAHIGWRGLCLGLIEKMLTHFDTATLDVYVGPFLHTFEIQKDFCYEQITQKFGGRFIEQKDEELIFNFKDAISSLLPLQTQYDTRDTATDLSLPSYRRDKTKERLTTVVSFSV